MFANSHFSRRRFLRGVSLGSSAAVLGPLLSRMAAEAAGEARPPQRVVFVVQGNGITSQTLAPPTVERPTKPLSGKQITHASKFRSVALADHALTADFEPLTPYKDRLAIVMGLSGRACQGGHSNNFGALGVYGANNGAAGQTIDCAIASALTAPFPHVGLGISRAPSDGVIYNISAWGRSAPAPIQCKPSDAHQALFGSVTPTGQPDFAALPHVLDFMADDLKRISGQLAGPERQKLQIYEQALAEMSRRHGAVREKDPVLRKLMPEVGPKYQSDTETDRLEAAVEIGGAALIGGLTNTLVLASGCGNRYFEVVFKGLGIGIDMHTIGHGGGENGKTSAELTTTIRRFHTGLVARLADKLAAVPEGDGTMLDNTTIVFMSDSGDGHHAANWEIPLVVLGNLGGKLQTDGRYIEFPHYELTGHRTIANFYCTLLHAIGAPRDTFGVADQVLPPEMQTGPLAELLS